MLLVALLVGSHFLYVADHDTFGCSSKVEVASLERLGPGKAFRAALYSQVSQGQCVAIPRGTLVEGAADPQSSALLLIDGQVEPPGFLAPRRDFHRRLHAAATRH